MKQFIQHFGDEITATLSGWDRLVLRGHLRRISYPIGMTDFLFKSKVLPDKHVGSYFNAVSKRLVDASCKAVLKQNRPIHYLKSPKINKEKLAKEIAKKDGIKEGLITVLKSVELCKSYRMTRNHQNGHLELKSIQRKCMFIYHYLIHPEFGFMNARIQSWFPFAIQVCINGREWLSRMLDKKEIAYQRYENCFPWIEDFPFAQRAMNRQLQTNWQWKLNRIAGMLNPIHRQIFEKYPLHYYWSVYQSEWATDVVFKDPNFLRRINDRLLLHGMLHSSSSNVMRFLGRKLYGQFTQEIISDYKLRPEGARIKHQAAKNGVKLYGKGPNILRAEATINNTKEMKTYRPSERNPNGEPSWRSLRNGVADLHRRAEISHAITERYLDNFACIDTSKALGELLREITQPVRWKSYRVRGLSASSPQDLALFQAVLRGEFAITGFRNRDLQNLLFKTLPESKQEHRSRSAKVSRMLRLLRAHHLIRRVPGTYRYMLTERGAILLKAIVSVQQITLDQINRLVA